MAKKTFDAASVTSRFFTQAAPKQAEQTAVEPSSAENQAEIVLHKKLGRPRLQSGERRRGYRYNLLLDADLNDFLHEIAWQRRTSMTQYINDLIRAEFEAYMADCESRGIAPFPEKNGR